MKITQRQYLQDPCEASSLPCEEQFPDQLRVFYEGVSGFLYRVEDSGRLKPVDGRPGMFYSTEPVPVAEVRSVPDVYEALLSQEAAGIFKVLRYTEQSPARQEKLVDLIASDIAHNGSCAHDEVRRHFMQTYFAPAWDRAMKNVRSEETT